MTNIQPPMEHFERPDPVLTNKIVTHLKSQGIFDQFRRECMADVDTKPAYHNLRQRVEGSVAAFLRLNPWRPDMNKNQLRDNLRKHIQSGGFLDIGVDRIVDQVVNPKIYTVFLPKVEEVVQNCLGMENNQPKFVPPPVTEIKTETPKFQDKHNLAPRAKLPAPLMGPMLKPLKPPDPSGSRSSLGSVKLMDNGGDTDTEEAADKKYVVDDDDLDEKEEDEDEDDEESPPFEPHSEGDRLILGMRSESSDNSNDSQLVTTIVDDSLEERIANNETTVKEESDKKDEESSSDEYVPKTPTINMEESDGMVLDFNSISEYKQYQTKFEEESVGNVEEVVSSQCINDNREAVKEERSSIEDYMSGSQKRRFNIDSYDDASSSSIDKESTSDEIKPAVFESFSKKRFKLEDYEQENETSELSMNDADNEDSYTERSLDMTDSKMKVFENDHYEKKGSSTSSKDSGKSYHLYHSHEKDLGETSNLYNYDAKSYGKQNQEEISSSHSSKDKKDSHKKSEKHESSKDRHKERDRKRSEPSSKHGEEDGRSKHYDKEREKVKDKKRSNSSERKKEKEDADQSRKESRHEHRDQGSKSRDHHDKEKKKHSSRDRHSDGKKYHDSVHKSDKDRRDDSKHSSSRHGHRSSSEKHKSDKDHKHKSSSGKHKSRDEKSEKDKEESRKKYRQHCKYSSDKDENRRSSDRDSSGPSSRNYVSSSSKSTSSRTQRETKVETGERTTSNSDNTVSDNIEALQKDSKFDLNNQHGILSPDVLSVEDSRNESGFAGSDCNSSREEEQQTFKSESSATDISNIVQDEKVKLCETLLVDSNGFFNSDHPNSHGVVSVDQVDRETDDFIESFNKNNECTNNEKQDFSIPSVSIHDSSSEKENLEQVSTGPPTIEHDDNNIDASLDDDSAVVKFKKPKIARNIHEVKKIMEARRHLKRMEKKRIKLLMKNNSEEYESDEKSPSEDRVEDGLQNDTFRGFEDVFSSEKIKKYDCLTERLRNEASQLEKVINYEQINSNLMTSWIDLNPDLDTYIENTLKGKVHRKYKVRLPPICDEYYKYDSEQNVYYLMTNLDVIEHKEVLVDSNLNNLNSVHSTAQQENKTFYNEVNLKRRKLNEGELPSANNEIIHDGGDHSKQSSPKRKVSSKKVRSDDEVEILEENFVSNNSRAKRTKNVNNKTSTSSDDVIASPKFNFNITFNQTYDEVLKEKAQNSVVPTKKEVEDSRKTSRTVVKITNNKTSEQVFMKQIQSNPEDKVEVPRITKTETSINGKIPEKPPESQQIPLISRITRTKKASTPPTVRTKFQYTNGNRSPEKVNNHVQELPRIVSQKIINDVIGIQDVTFDQGNISDQGSQSSEDSPEQRRRRMTGCRQQQRYDSSDLYKPRLQLSSRRVKSASSSPEESYPVSEMVSKRKRSAAADINPVTGKRRR